VFNIFDIVLFCDLFLYVREGAGVYECSSAQYVHNLVVFVSGCLWT